MRMEHPVRSRPVSRREPPGKEGIAGFAAPEGAVAPLGTMLKRVDINSATVDSLKSLSGIGPCYAKKIVEGRPYGGVKELRTRDILPSHIFARIVDQLGVRQP